MIVARIQPRAQDSVIIQLRGTPKTSPESATFILNLRTTSGSLKGCALRLVADGTLVPLTDAGEHKVVGSSQKLAIEIPLEIMSRLSTAERLIGQACEVRFECTPKNIAALGSFVVRFREELALLGTDVPSASAQPPKPDVSRSAPPALN